MPLHDRLVQVVSAEPPVSDGLKQFSEYSHRPNIVLLGDPGAGKSYLFREFAEAEGGESLVARAFLNLNSEAQTSKSILFIDALDERRAGRGDHSTIDEMVKKLLHVRPEKVRIACRAADWLGNTDLAAFGTYFERTGGCVVLNLLPLSNGERVGVLAAQGVEDASAFLIEASERGLGDLLGNPQNLTMLADVVKKRSWPNTRSELFRSAVDILLEEHSENQRRRPSGRYSPKDLRGPAGELCAVRLVSDILAISLTENDRAVDLPSYRSVCSVDEERALAALGRRVFVSGPVAESADYAHRTIAEYLGAFWLAERVRNGLPLGRVRALLGIDGRPASELRGLHAWLAVHLPVHAEVLIAADPFGVLSYADAKTLAPQLRQHLLQALADLADADPWFRDGHWSSEAVAGLSGPDMVAGFRSVLISRNSGFSLRMLVLDALSSGYVAVELATELEDLVSDQSATYAEREASVEVLFRMGPVGAAVLGRVYARLGKGEDELRIRSRIVRDMYRVGLGVNEVVGLLCDALSTATGLSVGVVWRVAENVADGDVFDVLDRLAALPAEDPEADEQHHTSDVLREFDSLLARALEIDPKVPGCRLLQWLEFRRRACGHVSDGNADELKELLARNQPATARVVDAAIEALAVDEKRWSLVHHLRELTLFGASDGLLLERVTRALHLESSDGKKAFLYDVALTLTFQVGQDARESFDALYSFADGREELEAIRQNNCIVEIPDWRIRDAERRRERAEKRSEGRAKNLAEFESQRELVRSGMHFGWLAWIAKVYFALFSDLDREVAPRERLAAELGERGAEVSIDGLIAFARRGEVTEVGEILRMHEEGKHFPWWYALLAGLDEYVRVGGDMLRFPDAFLQSALMIECTHATFVQKGHVASRHTPVWRTVLLQSRPDLVSGAYVALARVGLTKSAQHIDGLHALLNEVKLQPYRPAAALALLTEFPCAPARALHELVGAVIDECQQVQLIAIAREIVANRNCGVEPRVLWHAAGLLVAPAEFGPACERLEGEAAALLVWAVRDLSGFARHRQSRASKLTSEQIELILRLTLALNPRTPHPSQGWSGDRNAWDATDYALKLIVALSANPSNEAAKVLARLLEEPFAESYVGDIKHAVAQQRVKMIDLEFRQPSWAGAVAALASGTPAGIADLHALVLDHLEDLGSHIAAANIDVFKRFWNEDSYGRVTSPKVEESCRDYLVELLRARTKTQGILVEPEGHMAADKRADIVALLPGMKLVVELKRDSHAEVWNSVQGQLERFYTRDPDAQGFGIYAVFWFGEKRAQPIPYPPAPLDVPRSAKEMRMQLESSVAPERKSKVAIVVLDVSGEIPLVRRTEADVNVRSAHLAPVKFRDRTGNTWSGRGRRPKWLVAALADGERLEDFAVE
jgi:hypothetical protein